MTPTAFLFFTQHTASEFIGDHSDQELDTEINKLFLTKYMLERAADLPQQDLADLQAQLRGKTNQTEIVEIFKQKLGKESLPLIYAWYTYRRQFILNALEEKKKILMRHTSDGNKEEERKHVEQMLTFATKEEWDGFQPLFRTQSILEQ